MLNANYHTHTKRCGHAGDYEDEDYVKAALAEGMKILGFSDHTPWPYRTGYADTRIRMSLEQLPEYFESMAVLKENYKGRIRIYAGLECEYFPEYLDFLKEIVTEADYLIMGAHWVSSNEYGGQYYGHVTDSRCFRPYIDNLCEGMETGLFRVLAHPDFIFSDYPVFDEEARSMSREICREMKRLRLPIEYNISGFQKRRDHRLQGLGFPCDPFWEIAAEEGCTAIIGCDAHKPEALCYEEDHVFAKEFLESHGIPYLETLEGLA